MKPASTAGAAYGKMASATIPVAPQTSDVLVTYRTSWRQLYLRQLPYGAMADSLMSYAITAGIFAFLTAVLFSARFARKRHGEMTPESKHTEAA
jgi:hypothetical protein